MWFDEFITDFNQFNYIYIKTDYKLQTRVKKRARKGEEIPIEYLKKCQTYHDTWLDNKKLSELDNIVLDGNISLEQQPELHDRWCNQVKHHIMPVSNSTNIQPNAYLVE